MFPPPKSRAETLRTMSPQLTADVRLYATADGGRKTPAHPGWGCPCCCSTSTPVTGWDGWVILDSPLSPGETRRLGFVFLSGELAAQALRNAGNFYLWEGRFIGEAVVVAEEP
jgi:hypothetical protein